LISPANKDRDEERQAFVAKCARYLHQGVSVVVIDIVTTRHANLHNDLLHFLNAPAGLLPDGVELYAAAYRPVLRDQTPQIDVWAERCSVTAALPTVPLRLTGDLFVPVEFEATYLETCRQRRLIASSCENECLTSSFALAARPHTVGNRPAPARLRPGDSNHQEGC
jgi:hypothetical protein